MIPMTSSGGLSIVLGLSIVDLSKAIVLEVGLSIVGLSKAMVLEVGLMAFTMLEQLTEVRKTLP